MAELQSFLGLVNYCGKFLPDLATILSPLYLLLQKKHKRIWNSDHNDAFLKVKELWSPCKYWYTLIVHYLSSCCVMCCPYGVGAVLSHKMPEENDQSHSHLELSLLPKKHTRKWIEALAIVYGVKKYHQYLYGCQFQLKTDHRLLIHIFSEKKATLIMASSRIQRWASILGAYSYIIQFRKGGDNGNADALSRLPLLTTQNELPKPADIVHLMEYLDSSPITSSQVWVLTDQDPSLTQWDLTIESDVSTSGWGASCEGRNTGGPWTSHETSYHINYLELLAAFLALKSFQQEIFHHLHTKLGSFTIDWFTSRTYSELPLYCSWKPDPEALAVDALSISWRDHYPYMFPSFALIPRCLNKLIAPVWSNQIWFPLFLKSLIDFPILLPPLPDTVTNPQGLSHPTTIKGHLPLAAWPVSGSLITQKDFQKELLASSGNPGNHRLNTPTHVPVDNGIAGVLHETLVHFQFLWALSLNFSWSNLTWVNNTTRLILYARLFPWLITRSMARWHTCWPAPLSISLFKGSFQQSSTSFKIFFYMGCRRPKVHQEFARQQRVVFPKFIVQARYVDGIV